MDPSQLNWITNFIWGIADNVLRDLYVRGKYRDVILPMTVLRRLDAVLESTKQAVLDMKASLDKAKVTNQDTALRNAAGQYENNIRRWVIENDWLKAIVALPLRLQGIDPERAYTPKEIKALKETHERAEDGVPMMKKIRSVGRSRTVSDRRATRCAACSQRRLTEKPRWWSMNPTATCSTRSRIPSWKKAVSRPS